MVRFYLIILNYTDSKSILSREQKWTDLLKPEYNINTIAGNIKGYKHSIESKEKIRIASLGRKHTKAVKQIMSNSCKWVINPFLGKIHSNKSLALIKAATLNRKCVPISSIEVKVIDLYINITTVYKSIHKVAFAINSDIKSINFLFFLNSFLWLNCYLKPISSG